MDRRTDGGDCNIPDAFLKKRGDKNCLPFENSVDPDKLAKRKTPFFCEGEIEKSVPWDHSLPSLGKPHDAKW